MEETPKNNIFDQLELPPDLLQILTDNESLHEYAKYLITNSSDPVVRQDTITFKIRLQGMKENPGLPLVRF